MTTNRTIDGVLVPRELAKRLAVPMLRTPEYLFDHRDALDELRALLDANPEENVPCPECGGSLVTWGCTCTPRWPMHKPAVQPQGAPFAWYTEDYLTDKSATTYDLAAMERWKAKGWPVKPLYIEQPAPVAVDAVIHGSKLDEYDAVLDAIDPESVCPYLSNGEVAELVAAVRTLQVRQITQPAPVAVLPKRLQQVLKFLDGSGTLDGYSFGDVHTSRRKFWWRNELRACLDELKRLNPSL